FEIAPRVSRQHPVRRTKILWPDATHCLNGLRPLIHISQDPRLASFFLGISQFLMAEGVILDLVTTFQNLTSGFETGYADIDLVAAVAPGLGCEPPAHDKERCLDIVFIKHIE